jgi:hypothetical protein
MVHVKIKENSWLAHIAARKLRCSQVAMVIGKTIHLCIRQGRVSR